MKKLLDFFLFPERSNLQLALWLSRFLVVLAILWFLRACLFLGKVTLMFFEPGNSLLLLQTAGTGLLRSAQEVFGLALLGLIVSHVLVFSIVYLRDNQSTGREPNPDANKRLSNRE